jgi:hypothetical protein
MFVAADSFAADHLAQPQSVTPVNFTNESYTRPAAEPSPSDRSAQFASTLMVNATATPASCCTESSCCCEEPSCGCDDGSCGTCGNSCCSCGNGSSLFGDCCLGDPCTLQGELQPCCDGTYAYGGWVSVGYHSDFTRLSSEAQQGFSFNDRPNEFNFHQVWFYSEKVAEADCCSSDWGYRYDIMYGIDAQKIQSFGNESNTWDVSFDHGAYGWAMPQAYAEYAYGDWTVKAGRFFTLVGYEVATAPSNFFYSHSLTMFNSEPFAHTGVLGDYAMSDETTVHLGWVLGWDSGFDQFGNASAVHAGFIHQATDDVSVSYMMTGGDLGWRGDGYSHSIVVDVTLSDCWNYVLQSDYVNVSDSPVGVGPAGVTDNEDVGINQYLFYTMNDCWGVGGRMEWWKSNSPSGDATSFYELTGGINYRPHANVIVRPEVRYDWSPTDLVDADGDEYNNFVFGIDAIFTY